MTKLLGAIPVDFVLAKRFDISLHAERPEPVFDDIYSHVRPQFGVRVMRGIMVSNLRRLWLPFESQAGFCVLV